MCLIAPSVSCYRTWMANPSPGSRVRGRSVATDGSFALRKTPHDPDYSSHAGKPRRPSHPEASRSSCPAFAAGCGPGPLTTVLHSRTGVSPYSGRLRPAPATAPGVRRAAGRLPEGSEIEFCGPRLAPRLPLGLTSKPIGVELCALAGVSYLSISCHRLRLRLALSSSRREAQDQERHLDEVCWSDSGLSDHRRCVNTGTVRRPKEFDVSARCGSFRKERRYTR